MPNERFFKKLFSLGALWNIAIGLTGAIFYEFSVALFFGADAVAHNLLSVLSFRLFMIAIIAFGCGYWIVSLDLSLNRGIVWLGLACKIILFVIFTWLFAMGQATIMAFLAVFGDFIWSLMYMLFLWRTRHLVKTSVIAG